ncbi:MAG TPA: hypothetical protein VGH73_00685, partial [Thermoanaerobaculia bacterium]|jgi:hypothetical protein
MDRNPLSLFGGTMEAILEVSGAGKVVEACNRLSSALEAAVQAPVVDLPDGVRLNFHRVTALLAFPTWEEVVRWATTLNVDLRDLNEKELGHLERVSIKLVQRWRSEGTGPPYRNEAGIRYSLRDVWDWRRKGRQTMTAQGCRRGRKRQDGFS